MKKITIIGGGNLGSSLAKGLLHEEIELVVTGRREANLSELVNQGIIISTDNASSVSDADYVIVCVLPSQVLSVLNDISASLSNQILISTATDVKIEEMKEIVPEGIKIARAMPNTASAIGQSMTCLCSNDLNDIEMGSVKSLFESIGDTLVIEENLMRAATVLGASGIAFFLRYIRATTQGGIQMGFHPEEAEKIAVQTAIGAASLIKENHNHPEIEIDKVTTPRGCTIEGLNEMEHQGLSSAVIKGLMTSFDKINSIR